MSAIKEESNKPIGLATAGQGRRVQGKDLILQWLPSSSLW